MLVLRFAGPTLAVVHGDSRRGGRAKVFIDGTRRRGLGFRGPTRKIDFGERRLYRGLGTGRHRVRIVLKRGVGYVEGFIVKR